MGINLSPPPPLEKIRAKQGGGGLIARQATSAKKRKKPAKNATFSRNLAKNDQKSSYKRGGDLSRDRGPKKIGLKKGGDYVGGT